MSAFTPSDLETAAARLAARVDLGRPVACLVAGSGISLDIPGWSRSTTLPLEELLPFPIEALPGHSPTLSVWRRGERSALAFDGRIHLYQGYAVEEVTACARLAGLVGCPAMIATNAAGSLLQEAGPGSLVVLRDHLNLQGTNPLVGPWGRWRAPRFPAMTDAYDPALRKLALSLAERAGFTVREGVYAGLLGASFETPAEIEMLRRLGATVVGMSTVQEVIAARHLGMRVLVLSLVTNLAADIAPQPPSHQEVLEVGEAARGRLTALLGEVVAALAEEAP